MLFPSAPFPFDAFSIVKVAGVWWMCRGVKTTCNEPEHNGPCDHSHAPAWERSPGRSSARFIQTRRQSQSSSGWPKFLAPPCVCARFARAAFGYSIARNSGRWSVGTIKISPRYACRNDQQTHTTFEINRRTTPRTPLHNFRANLPDQTKWQIDIDRISIFF